MPTLEQVLYADATRILAVARQLVKDGKANSERNATIAVGIALLHMTLTEKKNGPDA